MRSYDYRHTVTFEDTNVVGNVYFVHHLRWQGICRELFLRDHAPDVLEQICGGLVLATTRCSCEYFEELHVGDEIVVRMTLAQLTSQRIALAFRYFRVAAGEEALVACGEQEIAFLRRRAPAQESTEAQLTATRVPDSLRAALQPYHTTASDATACRISTTRR